LRTFLLNFVFVNRHIAVYKDIYIFIQVTNKHGSPKTRIISLTSAFQKNEVDISYSFLIIAL